MLNQYKQSELQLIELRTLNSELEARMQSTRQEHDGLKRENLFLKEKLDLIQEETRQLEAKTLTYKEKITNLLKQLEEIQASASQAEKMNVDLQNLLIVSRKANHDLQTRVY